METGKFGAGIERRSAADIKAGQSRAKLDDANASTRPTEVTLAELNSVKRK